MGWRVNISKGQYKWWLCLYLEPDRRKKRQKSVKRQEMKIKNVLGRAEDASGTGAQTRMQKWCHRGKGPLQLAEQLEG